MLQPHIQLDEQGIRYALLPGDPGRVERIGAFLDDAMELGFSREYRSLRGKYKGLDILVMSTGMGGTSAAIGIEELRRIGVTTLIRVGSCGALQSGIRKGDLILACGAVRQDGVSRTYIEECYPAVPDPLLLRECEEAAIRLGVPYHMGIVRSHESFYLDNMAEINWFWASRRVLGSDQETAGVLTVSWLRGLRAASILNAVSQWTTENDIAEGVGAYAGGEDTVALGERREIQVALEALHSFSRKEN